MTNREYIENEIMQLPEGEVFVVADFAEDATYDNIRQIISRLEKEHKVRRIMPGIYDRPRYSELLQEYALPIPNKTAYAIARKNNWTIAPSGNVALNILGLSTQVPAKWSYISTGPSTEYVIMDNISISFTHRADKELSGMPKKTALVIQALKALGEDNINDSILSKISEKLTSSEKSDLLSESSNTINWIYEDIKKICKG